MISETLPALLDGQRVDRCVALIADCTRSEASDSIQSGHVTLNGEVAEKLSQRVRQGDVLVIAGDPTKVAELPLAAPGITFSVVYDDESLLVIDKPAGLVVHPGAGNRNTTLVNGLLERIPALVDVGDPARPGIVHRLDKGTSGLMVVAKTQPSYEALVEMFRSHSLQRRYQALVWGHMSTLRGTIDAPVGRSKRKPQQMAVMQSGRPATTHFEVVERFGEPADTTLLRCTLETGRTHQIRVHCQSIGRPIVGDVTYGGVKQSIRLDRPFLHSSELSFAHPLTAENLEFSSALPEDLAEVLGRLRP